jgi:hypothetical protein
MALTCVPSYDRICGVIIGGGGGGLGSGAVNHGFEPMSDYTNNYKLLFAAFLLSLNNKCWELELCRNPPKLSMP